MTLNFENLTIAQLRKLTEEYERLKIENVKLGIKYPNNKRALEENFAEDLIKGLE